MIQAYLLLIRERHLIAGLVAEHLAAWEYWDAVAEYATLLASDASVERGSRRAIVAYLQRCPRPEARVALASLGIAPRDLTPTGPPAVSPPDGGLAPR